MGKNLCLLAFFCAKYCISNPHFLVVICLLKKSWVSAQRWKPSAWLQPTHHSVWIWKPFHTADRSHENFLNLSFSSRWTGTTTSFGHQAIIAHHVVQRNKVRVWQLQNVLRVCGVSRVYVLCLTENFVVSIAFRIHIYTHNSLLKTESYVTLLNRIVGEIKYVYIKSFQQFC